MPIDSSIYAQLQAPKFDNPQDIQAKALTLQHLAYQNQINDQQLATDQAARAAFKNNLTTAPDGTTSLNKPALLSDLYKADPQKAMEVQSQLQKTDYDKQEQQLKVQTQQRAAIKDLVFSATPETWPSMYAEYQKRGLPGIENLTPQYPGDQAANALKMHMLTADEQLKQQNADRTYQAQRSDVAVKQEANSLQRERLGVDKDDKAAAALDKHLSTGWTARSGQAGTVQGKINSAEAAEALLEQAKTQQGGLDARQVEELSQSTAKLLGGGASASARVDALVPHTFMGRAQTMKEYLTNSPQGQDMQAFTDRLAETIAREKALATTQMRQYQIEGLPAHAGLKGRNPEQYNAILRAKGIDPSMIDANGRYKAPAAGGSAFHQMSDDDLDKAYKAAGGK